MPHIHEKIDFVVEVFIVYKNTVLLRKHDKYKIWLSVGGHIELDEDPNQAALREVKEEVGLDVTLAPGPMAPAEAGSTQLIPPRFVNRHAINDKHEHVAFIYFATSDSDKIVAESPDKSDECVWATKEDLQTMDLKPHIKYYAECALNELAK
jgi:8-oxo-dGTP pyrophosphatase MutT (NUDIX family)